MSSINVTDHHDIDRRTFVKAAGASALLALSAAGFGGTAATAGEASVPADVNMAAWSYDESSDIYWQVGVSYCASPADAGYETLGIFVPGAYFSASDNGDGTFTCAIDETGEVGGYTAATAPIVIPVNTPGYSAMSAPTGLSNEASTYTAAGFVYLQAGCRGRDHGAPAGVTDLKAAIRYYRANAAVLPGDTERIFSFGMSGGGAQSALLGATGDSDLYDPYLQAIGAVQDVSDAVAGSMCWCPITSLDTADEAYEWNLGATRSGLDEESQRISDALACAYGEYINALGLTDADGTPLVLEASQRGYYQAGTYYEHIKRVIEESLEHFLTDTEFPYTPSSSGGMGGGRPDGMGGGEGGPSFGGGEGRPDFGGGEGGPSFGGEMPDFGGGPMGEMDGTEGSAAPDGAEAGMAPSGQEGELPEGAASGEAEMTEGVGTADEQAAQYAADGIERTQTEGVDMSGTYETAADYIAALNADGEWVTYDEASGTVSITRVADFACALKSASKSLAAFDQLDRGQGENTLFGYGDGAGAHFDATLAQIMAGTEYEADFAQDLARTDELGNTVDVRLAMYSPLYYLCDYHAGAGTANVAPHWRIRTGINQGDTALCTEVNLALALQAYGAEVDFATVWGQGHTQAERTGTSTENFVAWVNSCCA